jgi:hypothetical protein
MRDARVEFKRLERIQIDRECFGIHRVFRLKVTVYTMGYRSANISYFSLLTRFVLMHLTISLVHFMPHSTNMGVAYLTQPIGDAGGL